MLLITVGQDRSVEVLLGVSITPLLPFSLAHVGLFASGFTECPTTVWNELIEGSLPTNAHKNIVVVTFYSVNNQKWWIVFFFYPNKLFCICMKVAWSCVNTWLPLKPQIIYCLCTEWTKHSDNQWALEMLTVGLFSSDWSKAAVCPCLQSIC